MDINRACEILNVMEHRGWGSWGVDARYTASVIITPAADPHGEDSLEGFEAVAIAEKYERDGLLKERQDGGT